MGDLKNKLGAILAGSSTAQGEISVIVELSLDPPDAGCIGQLQEAGLLIDEIIGNKIVGRIEGNAEATLRSLPFVACIERSVKLEPH